MVPDDRKKFREGSRQMPTRKLQLTMSEKWEYQVIQNMAITGGNKKLVPELNTLGQDGWEAVSVGAKASGAIEYVLMKRRIL